MGIFGGYMKEGPGIDKNAKKKKGIFLYFDIVFRKFMKLISANFAYLIVSIPFLLLAYMVLSSFVISGFGLDELISESAQALASSAEATAEAGADAASYEQMFYFMIRSMVTILLFNFLGSGPASAAYAYVTRCYTRGEHAWIMSDGWDKMKENLKQSVLVLIIDILVIILGMNAIAFYTALAGNYTGGTNMILTMAKYIIFVIISLYFMMHIYIYQIMVTYECKFVNLMKSAALITLAKLPMSVLLSLIAVGGAVLLFTALPNPVLGILIYALIGIIVMRYSMEFYAARVLEKNIKAVKKQNTAKITYTDEAL